MPDELVQPEKHPVQKPLDIGQSFGTWASSLKPGQAAQAVGDAYMELRARERTSLKMQHVASLKNFEKNSYYKLLVLSWLLYDSPLSLSKKKAVWLKRVDQRMHTIREIIQADGSIKMQSFPQRHSYIEYKFSEPESDERSLICPISSEGDNRLYCNMVEDSSLMSWQKAKLSLNAKWRFIYTYGEWLTDSTLGKLKLGPLQLEALRSKAPRLLSLWRELRIYDLILAGYSLDFLRAGLLWHKWNYWSKSTDYYGQYFGSLIRDKIKDNFIRLSYGIR